MLNDTLNQTVIAAAQGGGNVAARKAVTDACIQLARTGTKESVVLLSAMLVDEERSHMARYAMETISDASVDEALRDALGKVGAKLKVGIIGSLGVRKDRQAVPALIEALKDSDPVVACAAARALGSIGTREGADALMEALDNATDKSRLGLCEALFRVADGLEAMDRKDIAVKFYKRLAKVDELPQVKHGAEFNLNRLK